MIPIAHPLVGKEELAAVKEVLESGQLAMGSRVNTFEDTFAAYLGRRRGVATSNGTTALHAALLAHGVGRGQEVIVPPLSFFATASMVLVTGAKPIFADVDRERYTMDPVQVKKLLSPKTAAILPVHLYGQTADMDPILELAEDRGVPVIEDAAQAHGAEYHGRKAGNLGATACFSFYATKNMTTGEGGMVVTDDDAVADRVRLLVNQGQASKYEHVILGYNYRMTEIQAAIGLVQLRKLDAWVRARRKNAAVLTRALEAIDGLTPPAEGNWMVHSYYQYIVRTETSLPLTRDEIVMRLTEAGVGCRPSYPMPLYRQKAMRDRRVSGKCPVSEETIPRLFELPVHPALGGSELESIISSLREVAAR